MRVRVAVIQQPPVSIRDLHKTVSSLAVNLYAWTKGRPPIHARRPKRLPSPTTIRGKVRFILVIDGQTLEADAFFWSPNSRSSPPALIGVSKFAMPFAYAVPEIVTICFTGQTLIAVGVLGLKRREASVGEAADVVVLAVLLSR